jgi:hypothetical protein
MRAFLKPLVYILLLVVSPFVLALIAGAIFLGGQIANGVELSKGVENLRAVVNWLIPYLPYITGLPALFVLLFLIKRNRQSPS